MSKFRIAVLALAALLSFACEEKDTTPPPAPVVDPVDSPTPLTKVSVTGSAEFGATVTLAGATATVTTTADRFTARWRATVELAKDADTTLRVTATDAAGNVSEPTEVTVTQASPRPAQVTLTVATPVARAGEMVGLTAVVLDQYGHTLDAPVTLESTPALAATFTVPNSMPAVTRPQGVLAMPRQFVAYDLSGVAATDFTFQLKATAGGVSDTRPLVVRPAPGASFSKLKWTSTTQNSLQVAAGIDATYDYEVIDLYGNVTSGPVSAFTGAPGAVVIEDGVSGHGTVAHPTTVGTFPVSFFIAGVGQKGSLSLSVGTAPAAIVDVTASATLTSPQTAVKIFARVRDTFGNPISCTMATAADVTFTVTGATTTGPTPAAPTCFNGAFETSVTFTAEDNYTVTATHQPTGAMGTSASVFITVLNFDNTPPQVSIANITVNGAPCTPASRTGGAGCDAASGDTIEFDAVATDNSALAQVAYNIFFESTQSTRTRTVFVAANQNAATVHFRFTINSNAIESSPLVAMAIDRAGNIMNSAAVVFFINNGVPLGGRSLGIAAQSPLLNRPQDVVTDSTGALFVVNRGSNTVVKVSAGVAQVFANGLTSEFLARSGQGANERVFLSDRNANGVVRGFDPASAAAPQTWATFAAGRSRGLAVLSATPARGWVDAAGAADGDRLTVTQNGTVVVYELDSNASCTAAPPALLCAAFTASGATGATRATALAAAINGNPASVVSATIAGSATSRVNLATKVSGELTVANTVSLTVTGGLVRSTPQLVEGHDPDLWVANDGDNTLRRFVTTGTPPVGNHGTFNVGAPQFGLAVRDVWTTANDRLFDATEAWVDLNNTNQLLITRTTVTANAGTTTTTTAPAVTVNNGNFNTLWDVQLLPSGCLAVTDDGNGDVYAIDTSDPANTNPAIERIARGIPGPRGLALDASGNLLIAVDQGNVVLRLGPTAATTDCF